MEKTNWTVYSLRIELLHIKPFIWRRVWIPSDTVLQRLHKIIQVCMGWEDYHLHEFRIGEQRYAVPSPEDFDRDLKDERGQRLDRLLLPGISEFLYLYDFGDGWEHRIVVEDQQVPRGLWSYPVCVAGERACPPEDVGGPPGYDDFVRAMRDQYPHPDPQADEDDDASEEDALAVGWIGGFYDPEGFDANAVNIKLAKMRKRSK
jgi:hypothetical protein